MAISAGTAYVELRAKMDQFNSDLKKAEGAVDSAGKTMSQKFEAVGAKMVSSGKRMTTAISLPIVGLGALAIKEFGEVEQVNAQTEAALKSTGGAAGVTATEIKSLAERMGELSARDAEEVQSATNVLLTFTKVRNEMGEGNKMFDRTAEAALNLSARMGTDLNAAMLQVGKAVNDPIKGVSALGRAGVQFTEEQKAMIEGMVEAGDVMGAQKIVLSELETQFGGSAKAAGDAASPMTELKLAFNDMAESLGEVLMPFIRKAADFLTDLASKFKGLSPEARKWIVTIGGIAAAIGPLLIVGGKLVSAFGQIGKAFSVLSKLMMANPWVLLIAATVALVVIIVKNWDKISEFLGKTWTWIKETSAKAWAAIKNTTADIVGGMLGFLTEAFANFIGFFFDMAGKILDGAALAFGWVPEIGDKVEGFRDQFKATTDGILEDLHSQAAEFQSWGETSKEELVKVKDGFQSMGSEARDQLGRTREKSNEVSGKIKDDFQGSLDKSKEHWGGWGDKGRGELDRTQEKGGSVADHIKDGFAGALGKSKDDWGNWKEKSIDSIKSVKAMWANMKSDIEMGIDAWAVSIKVEGKQERGDGFGNLSGALVDVGKTLQGQGFLVGEHPAFGGVAPVHATNSYHYSGRALDINWPGADEYGQLNALAGNLRQQLGDRIQEMYWPAYDPVGGHSGHLHLAMFKGGVIKEPVLGRGIRTGMSYSFGETGPETVMPGVHNPYAGTQPVVHNHYYTVNAPGTYAEPITEQGLVTLMKRTEVLAGAR